MLATDYSNIPLQSLKQFYANLLTGMDERKKKFSKLINETKDQPFNSNYYFLIFDAMKILPGFKEELLLTQKEEIKIWASHIKHARESREIKTVMTDIQLAKLFMYSGDGVGISMILEENLGRIKTEIKSLWDGLYESIKI